MELVINTPCKFLKGILVLFEVEQSYTRNTRKFYSWLRYIKFQSLSKANSICYTPKECVHSSNLMKAVRIFPKESRWTTMPMSLRNSCNSRA